jgi:hypothetical protein
MGINLVTQRIQPLPFLRHGDVGRCDLGMTIEIAVMSLSPLLHRRHQRIMREPAHDDLVIEGDARLAFDIVLAALREAAGLSSVGARIRLAVDDDEGDTVVTIVGVNTHQIALPPMARADELSQIAELANVEASLFWDADEGPTIVLRFQQGTVGWAH